MPHGADDVLWTSMQLEPIVEQFPPKHGVIAPQ